MPYLPFTSSPRHPTFAQLSGRRVQEAVVALAVAVLKAGGTKMVVTAVVDRIRAKGLHDYAEETYYRLEEGEEDVSEELGAWELDRVRVSQRILDQCVPGDL